MTGEPAHKEPQVTTDEFIARNGKSGKSTRDDAQQVLRCELAGRARWRENVRVHIPTFPVTPGVSDIFRRGDIYSCFGFLSLPLSLPSFLGPCQTVRVLLPVSAGPPTSMTCAFSPSASVRPFLHRASRHHIEFRTRASKKKRTKQG